MLQFQSLPIFSVSAVFFALNIAFIGYYQSIEKGGLGMWGAIPVSELLTLVVILLNFFKRKNGRLPTSKY